MELEILYVKHVSQVLLQIQVKMNVLQQVQLDVVVTQEQYFLMMVLNVSSACHTLNLKYKVLFVPQIFAVQIKL